VRLLTQYINIINGTATQCMMDEFFMYQQNWTLYPNHFFDFRPNCAKIGTDCYLGNFMPTILRVKDYRFFFFSREELRQHVHIQSQKGEAKFWLEP